MAFLNRIGPGLIVIASMLLAYFFIVKREDKRKPISPMANYDVNNYDNGMEERKDTKLTVCIFVGMLIGVILKFLDVISVNYGVTLGLLAGVIARIIIGSFDIHKDDAKERDEAVEDDEDVYEEFNKKF